MVGFSFTHAFPVVKFFILDFVEFLGKLAYFCKKNKPKHYEQQEIESRTEDRSRCTIPLRGFRGNCTGAVAGGYGPLRSFVYGKHRHTYLSFSDKGKVPIFLGSSFAFIAPIVKATELYGLPGTLSGLAAVGAVYGIMSALVRFRGLDFIKCMFPPVVVGPVIMLIGLSLTKIAEPVVIRIAAVVGILFSVLGKISAILKTIPSAVLGGIMLLLFGTIASVGINSLIKNKVDMGNTRNLVIASLILTLGIGGAEMNIGNITIGGIGLAALVGVVLNLIIPKSKNK